METHQLALADAKGFDAEWYLSEYPDVAKAGIDPLVHYLDYGRREGRQPRHNPAIVLEHWLWRGLAALIYLEHLRRHTLAVAVVPYGWWQQGRPMYAPTLRALRALIDHFCIDRVHVNTAVLAEPLQAARDASVPVWMHLRELPTHDPELRSSTVRDITPCFP